MVQNRTLILVLLNIGDSFPTEFLLKFPRAVMEFLLTLLTAYNTKLVKSLKLDKLAKSFKQSKIGSPDLVFALPLESFS